MKKIAIILLIVLVVLGVVGYFGVKSLFSEKKADQGADDTNFPEESMKRLPEDAVSAEVSLNYNKTRAIVKVTKFPKNAKAVEYEVLYTADLKDANNMPRGSNGKVSSPGADGFMKEVLLGTCSKSVCTYEKNPRDFKLKLRITQENGERAIWEKSFPGI
jgi:hypothetical protein